MKHRDCWVTRPPLWKRIAYRLHLIKRTKRTAIEFSKIKFPKVNANWSGENLAEQLVRVQPMTDPIDSLLHFEFQYGRWGKIKMFFRRIFS